MNNKDLALPAEQDRAVAASPSSPQAVSPVPASIPSAAWLIWATEGEYSDRSEWPVAVVADKETAEAITERLGALWRQILNDHFPRASYQDLPASDPNVAALNAITGGSVGYLGYDADSRSYTCCEVQVLTASAIEARSDATGTGAAEGESAGPQDDAQLSSGKSS